MSDVQTDIFVANLRNTFQRIAVQILNSCEDVIVSYNCND